MSEPKFTKQLADVTVTEREKTILECKVEATPSPTIVWQCNGKDLKVCFCCCMLVDRLVVMTLSSSI